MSMAEIKMRSHGVRIALVVSVALVLVGAVGCNDDQSPQRSSDQPGKKKQETAQEKLRGEFLARHKLAGRVVLVEFGLVGCELSEQGLERMVRMHRDEAVAGLAYVRVEASKEAAEVDEYYKAKSLKFPLHRDPGTSLAQAFDATVYPVFVLVGKFGRVRYRGKFPDDRLEGWVGTLLAEKTPPGPNPPLLGAVKLDGPKLLAGTRLPALDGARTNLDACMGPEGLMVVFVDTTCPYSEHAMGDMPKVAGTLSGLKINSVLVNIGDAEKDVKKYFAGKKPVTKLLYDVTTRTAQYWDVSSVPTVVFVDPGGQIGYKGKAVWAEVAAAIEKTNGLAKGTVRFTAKGTKYG